MVLSKFRKKKLGRKRFSRRSTVRSLAKRVKVLESEDETKILYNTTYAGNGLQVTTAGSVTLINGLGTGSNNANRVGNKISITGFRIMGQFLVGDLTNSMMGAVVWDVTPSGALPAISTMFETSLFTNNSAAFVPKDWDNRKRFRILSRKNVVGTGPSATPGGPGTVKFSMVRKFKKPLTTIYQGTGATIASIVSGGLYVVFVTDSQIAVNPSVCCAITLFYKDA